MYTAASSIGGMLGLLCMIWVLYEVWAVNKYMSTGKKIIWSLAAVFFNIITAIVFYFMVKREEA